MQAKLAEDLETQDLVAYLVEPLVAQVPVVSAMFSPADKQDLPQVDLEVTLAPHHPTPAPSVELYNSAPPT